MRIIRGKFGRRRFDVPTNITARPTTDFARENIFNVLENMVDFEGDAPSALDLFAGTGAVSFEFLSRGCSRVTSVEKAATQSGFIRKVAAQLGVENEHTLVRGDALKFIESAGAPYDIVFADPPYDMPGFAEIPAKVLGSKLLAPKAHDFSQLPHFYEHRAYGSVNFSIFRIPDEESATETASDEDSE